MVDALSDWRDSDDVARPMGAEADWYVANLRERPRNAALADIRELTRVRGFEDISAFDSVLTTEPGRVSLATASVSVLMAVPGITRETAEKVVALRDAGTPIRDPALLAGMISRTSADSLMARFPDIVRSTTPDPDAWNLTVHARSGFPAVTVALCWRLIRLGKRSVVVRTWSPQ
jgi:type II secretory pathway component PulK